MLGASSEAVSGMTVTVSLVGKVYAAKSRRDGY
jgi:hypothetical protein